MKKTACWTLVVLCLGATGLAQSWATVMDRSGSYLGVSLRDVVAGDVSRLALSREAGAVVEDVQSDSPAERAGLQGRDVIVGFAGVPVLSVRQLQRLVSETPAGREVELTVVRDGREQVLRATVESRPGRLQRFSEIEIPELRFEPKIWRGQGEGDPGGISILWSGPRLGVEVQPLTGQMADFLGISGEEGLLIMQVDDDSVAARAGLQAGDAIVAIDGDPVSSTSQLRSRLRPGRHELEFFRNGSRQSVEIEFESPSSREPRSRSRKIRL